jgi:Lipocalin-like domain
MTKTADTPNPLVGTWKLISFQFEAEGSDERRDAYDAHPIGFLIITADGRMMTLLTASDRAQDAPAGSLFDRMMAYSGRYRLEGDDRFVAVVDVAWYPTWVGTEQTRFFKLDGETLSIISAPVEHPAFPGRRIRGVIVWRRE